MNSNQADYIFVQTQEIFPQLEASVIYMVLSENDFKLDEALPSLTLLAQTVEDAAYQKNDVYQFDQSFSQLDNVQSLFLPPHKKLQKTKSKKAKKENSHQGRVLTETASEYSSGYLPFYEELYDTTQIFDSGDDPSHCIYSNTETSSFVADSAQLSTGLRSAKLSDNTSAQVIELVEEPSSIFTSTETSASNMLLSATSLLESYNGLQVQTCQDPNVANKLKVEDSAGPLESLELPSKSNDHLTKSSIDLHIQASQDSIVVDDFSIAKEAALNLKSSKISTKPNHESESTTDKTYEVSKKIVTLQSYLSVGLVNGKRFVYSGSTGKVLKEGTNDSLHSSHDTNSTFTNKKTIADTNKCSKSINGKSKRQQKQTSFSATTNCDKASDAKHVSHNLVRDPFLNNTVVSASPPAQSQTKNVSCVTDDNFYPAASNIDSPLNVSTSLSWSRGNSGTNDPIKFLTHFQAQPIEMQTGNPKVSTYNPPQPQRMSSLQNPIPFCPPTFANGLDAKGEFPSLPNSHDSSTSAFENNSTNTSSYGGLHRQNSSHLTSWNNFKQRNFNSPQNNLPYQPPQRFGVNNSLSSKQRFSVQSYSPDQIHSHNSSLKSEKYPTSTDSSKWLYILRGPPGCGKSTLSKNLNNGKGVVLATDDYFMTARGYVFDVTLLSQVHNLNHQRAKECMLKGISPVIIDNTNLTSWEMKPYMSMAVDYGYKIEMFEPNTWWKYKATELAKRNVHHISKERIKNMLERYEKEVTIKSVLGEELYRRYEMNCLKRTPKTVEEDIVVSTEEETTIRNSSNTCDSFKVDDCDLLTLKPTNSDQKSSERTQTSVDDLKTQNNKEVLNETTTNLSVKPESSTEEKNGLEVALKSSTSTSSINDAKSPKEEQQFTADCSSVLSPKHPTKPVPETAATKSKTIKKPKSLAARFQSESLSKQLDASGDDWKSFLQIIETEKPDSSHPEVSKQSAFSRCNVATITDDAYFGLLSELDSNDDVTTDDVATDDVVLRTNSNRFQPATKVKLFKLKKMMYDKSTFTDNVETESSENNDIETLRLLFPDHSLEDLTHIYATCDKKLDWATDVIADSSLFGVAGNTATNADKPCSSMSLDAYFDEVCGDKTADVRNHEGGEVGSKPLDNSGSLTLNLSAQFLLQLITLFGDEADVAEDHALEVDTELAHAIYMTWRASKCPNKSKIPDFQSSSAIIRDQLTDHMNRRDQMKRDEELARRIQKEEKMLSASKIQTPPSSRKRNKKNHIRSLFSPNESDSSSTGSGKWSVDRVDRPPTLSQIMQEESAAAVSEKRQTTKFGKMKLAPQVKRDELHAMYHTISPKLLDDIFAANNYNLEETMFAVNCVFCEDDDLCFKTFTVSKSLETHIAEKKGKNKPLNPNISLTPPDTTESKNRLLTFDDVHSDLYATYDDVRTEANLQRTQMHECQRKVALANHQKKGELAYYYAQQAYEHQKRLRGANQRAAAIIYKRMNEGRSPNDLDLHGLHVDEAIDTLRSVLHQLQSERTGLRHLNVITGRGLNSADGIPRIKKAVMEWLKNKQIPYEPLNDGCVKITW